VSSERLKVSIVIPVLNEAREIEMCLRSLNDQSFRDFEVIVVDNGSTDSTEEIIERYNCRVIHEPRQGVGYARQRGFEEAIGEIIASTDADTILPADWLEKVVRCFEANTKLVGVYGTILFKERQGWALRISEFLFTLFLRSNQFLRRPSFCGPNFAVLNKAFHHVNGFKNGDYFYSVSEDLQLAMKLRKEGDISFCKELVVYTSSRRLNNKALHYIWTHTKNYCSIAWLGRVK